MKLAYTHGDSKTIHHMLKPKGAIEGSHLRDELHGETRGEAVRYCDDASQFCFAHKLMMLSLSHHPR